jgi:hypothetical protein
MRKTIARLDRETPNERHGPENSEANDVFVAELLRDDGEWFIRRARYDAYADAEMNDVEESFACETFAVASWLSVAKEFHEEREASRKEVLSALFPNETEKERPFDPAKVSAGIIDAERAASLTSFSNAISDVEKTTRDLRLSVEERDGTILAATKDGALGFGISFGPGGASFSSTDGESIDKISPETLSERILAFSKKWGKEAIDRDDEHWRREGRSSVKKLNGDLVSFFDENSDGTLPGSNDRVLLRRDGTVEVSWHDGEGFDGEETRAKWPGVGVARYEAAWEKALADNPETGGAARVDDPTYGKLREALGGRIGTERALALHGTIDARCDDDEISWRLLDDGTFLLMASERHGVDAAKAGNLRFSENAVIWTAAKGESISFPIPEKESEAILALKEGISQALIRQDRILEDRRIAGIIGAGDRLREFAESSKAERRSADESAIAALRDDAALVIDAMRSGVIENDRRLITIARAMSERKETFAEKATRKIAEAKNGVRKAFERNR